MSVVISWIKQYSFLNDGQILSGQNLGDIQSAIEQHSHTDSPASFLSLNDTPDSYLSQASKFVKVNITETGLEFAPFSVNLATDVSGVLPIANGGTGATTRLAQGRTSD